MDVLLNYDVNGQPTDPEDVLSHPAQTSLKGVFLRDSKLRLSTVPQYARRARHSFLNFPACAPDVFSVPLLTREGDLRRE
jgi:hypothetical protein